ncbi:MAG: arginine repressor [Clostridia bacterium]|nr:arginine repressor [Clostridia bacterium]
MKNQRQEKILELISKYDIGSQDALMEKLRESGFEITQATVSRDIRELKLSRVISGKGQYKYVPPTVLDVSNSVRFNGALAEAITSVDYAGNIVVVKTNPGLAPAVATGIDAQDNNVILGSIAGDDTIFVVTRDEESAGEIANDIKKMTRNPQ